MSYDTIQNLRLQIRITSLENDQYFGSLFRESFAPNGSGMCTPGFISLTVYPSNASKFKYDDEKQAHTSRKGIQQIEDIHASLKEKWLL